MPSADLRGDDEPGGAPAETAPTGGDVAAPRPARAWALDIGCGLLAAAIVAFCSLSPIWEMDTFWHLAVGEWILEHRALPTANVWSAADPAQPYRAVQWLYEAVAAAIDGAAGLEGLRLVNAAWLTATFVGFFLLVRRRIGLAPVEALAWTLALLAVYQDRIRIRPHVVSLTIEIGLVFFLLSAPKARRWHAVVFVPLFAAWSAIHAGGSWVVLLCLSAVALVALVWERFARARDVAPLLLLCAGAAAVGWVLNPEALGSMWTISLGPTEYVREWLPWPALGRDVGAIGLPGYVLARLFPPAAALALALAGVRYLRRVARSEEARRRHGVPHELLFGACLVLLSFVWVRYFYFAALALVLAHEALRRQSEALELPPRRPPRARRLAAAAAVSLLVPVVLSYEVTGYPSLRAAVEARGVTVDGRQFPVATTELLVESGIEARVGTLSNWGGYVSYHGFPRLRTTVDGRFIAPDAVLSITRRIVLVYEGRGDPAVLHRLFSALPVDFVLMPHPAFPRGAPRGEWMLVAETPVEDLYIRRSAASEDWLRRLRETVERHQGEGGP